MVRYTMKKLFTKKKVAMIILSGALFVTPLQHIIPIGKYKTTNQVYAATSSSLAKLLLVAAYT